MYGKGRCRQAGKACTCTGAAEPGSRLMTTLASPSYSPPCPRQPTWVLQCLLKEPMQARMGEIQGQGGFRAGCCTPRPKHRQLVTVPQPTMEHAQPLMGLRLPSSILPAGLQQPVRCLFP